MRRREIVTVEVRSSRDIARTSDAEIRVHVNIDEVLGLARDLGGVDRTDMMRVAKAVCAFVRESR